MNPSEHRSTSNSEPLSKILRKRKSRKTIFHHGLRDIQESRFEQHFYSVGRSSIGSGSQWVTTRRMDNYKPALLGLESANLVPVASSVQSGAPIAKDFTENVTVTRNKYVKI